jgi:hypothetical protein
MVHDRGTFFLKKKTTGSPFIHKCTKRTQFAPPPPPRDRIAIPTTITAIKHAIHGNAIPQLDLLLLLIFVDFSFITINQKNNENVAEK